MCSLCVCMYVEGAPYPFSRAKVPDPWWDVLVRWQNPWAQGSSRQKRIRRRHRTCMEVKVSGWRKPADRGRWARWEVLRRHCLVDLFGFRGKGGGSLIQIRRARWAMVPLPWKSQGDRARGRDEDEKRWDERNPFTPERGVLQGSVESELPSEPGVSHPSDQQELPFWQCPHR